MADSVMTLEQFEEFAKTLPEGVNRKKVAKAMGLELPVVIPPLDDQLKEVGLINHTPKETKRNPSPQETLYVAVPSLKLSKDNGTRSFWVKAEVARRVANQILSVCNDYDL
ncbi:hypothetical protein LCGC14_3077240 [marine sediment metagenome]|uniref:Uncharacterized protein n=1 Tax=marine sediment metagenome TaxID=412755 RepID=A0A0F8Z508_9ZZZZ